MSCTFSYSTASLSCHKDLCLEKKKQYKINHKMKILNKIKGWMDPQIRGWTVFGFHDLTEIKFNILILEILVYHYINCHAITCMCA